MTKEEFLALMEVENKRKATYLASATAQIIHDLYPLSEAAVYQIVSLVRNLARDYGQATTSQDITRIDAERIARETAQLAQLHKSLDLSPRERF